MIPTKTLGLVALIALTAIAFLSTGSAMAESTALCGVDEGECASPVTHIHEATLAGKKAVVKTSLLTVECDVLFLGNVAGFNLSSPLWTEGNFTYTNCGGCTVEEEKPWPSDGRILTWSHETATVLVEFELHLICSGLNCHYYGFVSGNAKGPLLSFWETNGEVSLFEQTLSKTSGLFCPSFAFLSMVTTPLSPVYYAN